jgi:putative ABC transport system permease protein
VAVGALASLTGTALGALLAPILAGPLVTAGAEPTGYSVHARWWPIAVSLVTGPLLSAAGAVTASWRASRVPPLHALRDAAVEERPMGRVRWTIGLLFAALGLTLVVVMATADDLRSLGNLALTAAMALISAAALLSPAVVPPLARFLGAIPARLLGANPARRSGAIGLLVREGAAAAPRRTASVAAPVLLTLAFSILVSGLFATSTASYAARRTAAVEAGSVLAPDGTPGLSDAAVTPLLSSESAALLPSSAYTADHQALQLLGADPAKLAAANNRARTLTALTGPDDAALSQATATRLGLASGSTLRLTFADGTTAPVRIVTVLPDNVIPADVLVNRAGLRAHDPGALTSAVLLPATSGPLVSGPGARVISVAAWADEQDAQDDRVAWLLVLLLMGVSAGYGALALVNTLLMAADGRAPDFRLLRRAGATPRQVGQAAAGEAVLVVAIGALLAGAIAVPALLGIRAGLSEQVGTHVPLVVPWATIGGILGATLILAMAAAALPACRAVRSTRPARRSVRSVLSAHRSVRST